MNKLYLIRHGKTAANLQHLYCGSTDLPLSDIGAAELKSLSYPISHVRFVTSGMKRTEQTLGILFGPVPHEINTGFREVDFGLFEMKSYEQLKGDPLYQLWLTGDNQQNVPPNGESGAQMTGRVLRALKELQKCEKDTVLVTHGGVIAAIMASLFPQEDKNRYQWQPQPGHGYLIEGEQYRKIP